MVTPFPFRLLEREWFIENGGRLLICPKKDACKVVDLYWLHDPSARTVRVSMVHSGATHYGSQERLKIEV